MDRKIKSFEELITSASTFLHKKLLRTKGTVNHYQVIWRKIERFMEANNLKNFTKQVHTDFLFQHIGNRSYSTFSKREKDIIRASRVLLEFHNTGRIESRKQLFIFEGSIGQLMLQFIAYKTSLRLKRHTIEEHQRYLYRFLVYLQESKITEINSINQLHILQYIKGLNINYSSIPYHTIATLGNFFKYLYEHKLIKTNMARFIPKIKYTKQAKLPSVYSAEEIQTILEAIDRGNSTGKRNYVIVLLVSRLGMRASDIANLKFSNINWEHSIVEIQQFKTEKNLVLPILDEIGEAIIDYLKHSRAKSDQEFIFLKRHSPYEPIKANAITGIVHSCFVKAGINIKNRKHGSHALRHSLAGILLERGTTLPVISEVLGHKNTASTKYYLRIDLKSMRQCALDVIPVSNSFYTQKGGYFYE